MASRKTGSGHVVCDCGQAEDVRLNNSPSTGRNNCRGTHTRICIYKALVMAIFQSVDWI